MSDFTRPSTDAAPPRSRLLAKKLEVVRSFTAFLLGKEIPTHPLSVYLEVSNACDLKCAMCGPFSALSAYRKASLQKENRGFMSPHNLGSALESVLDHALEVHCFGYGEPTINPDFRHFLDLADHHEVTVDFFTNGMHLTDQIVRDLVDKDVCQLTISFSGATREDYENIYIGGKFDHVLGGIRRLADYKNEKNSRYPHIVINSLGYKHHLEKLEVFMEVMGRAGANQVQLGPVYRSFAELETHIAVMRPWVEGDIIARARDVGAQFGTRLNSAAFEATRVKSDVEYDARIAEQHRIVRELTSGQSHIPIDKLKSEGRPRAQHDPAVVGVAPEVFRDQHLRGGFLEASVEEIRSLYDFQSSDVLDKPGIHCYEPFKTLYVTRSQNVKPCCNAIVVPPSAPLGTLRENTGKEIWIGTPYAELRKGMLDAEYPNMCHGCMKNKTAYLDHFFGEIIGRYATWYEHRFRKVFPVDLSLLSEHHPRRFWDDEATGLRRAQADPPPSPVAPAPPRRRRMAWLDKALRRFSPS